MKTQPMTIQVRSGLKEVVNVSVKAYVKNGLMVYKDPDVKGCWRIGHTNGLALPARYLTRKRALSDFYKLIEKDWTIYNSQTHLELREFYQSTVTDYRNSYVKLK
jgi:hypothetical protein